MSDATTSSKRRARRAARWYPHQWRERYGDEFEATLESEIADTPHSPVRAANIVWGGLHTRLAYVGLVGDVLSPAQQRRSSFSILAFSSLAFFTFGVVTWSKFQIGGFNFNLTTWYGSHAMGVTDVIMSWSFVGLIAIAILAALPLWVQGLHLALRTRSRAVIVRLCTLPLGIGLLAWGYLRFDAALRNFLDGSAPYRANLGVPYLVYDAYIQVRSFVGHPAQLFNARPDVALEMWSGLVEVIAVTFICFGVATLIGRVELSPRMMVFERRMTFASLILMGTICLTIVSALIAMPVQVVGIYADRRLAQGSVLFMIIALTLSAYAVRRAYLREAITELLS